jgi:hypothetical protein
MAGSILLLAMVSFESIDKVDDSCYAMDNCSLQLASPYVSSHFMAWY